MSSRVFSLLPKLRFPEFRGAGEWEKKSLDEIALFYKGKGISKSDIDLQGKTPCIRYGELYTTYGEVIRVVFSKTRLPLSELFLSQKNDVLIPSSGETKLDIAKASCVLLDDVALGGDLNVLRPNESGIFLSYLLNGAYKSEIAKKAQGDTVVHLYSSQLKLLDVTVPKEPEQQKIADCLCSLDELIATQSQKLGRLKSRKKGLMQQLFPADSETIPKLRFPEFRDAPEWEEKLLGEIGDVLQGYGFPEKYQGEVEAEYPFYKVSDISNSLKKGEHLINAAANYISGDTLKILKAKAIPAGTTIFARIGEAIRSNRRVMTTIPCVIDNNVAGLKCIKGKSLDLFLYYLMTNVNLGDHAGGVVPAVNKSAIEIIAIACPSIPEQKRIADFLASIDEIVATQTQKLDSLKAHKKGLMQQLFPSLAKV